MAVVVACCQLDLQVGEQVRNRAKSEAAIVGAAERGANVVVLPELVSSGYVFADAGEAQTLAEPVTGATVEAWITHARTHSLVIVGGLCELEPSGALRNSAVVVDETGLRAVYRKAHLWDREKLVFLAGDEQPPVVETRYGRIATVVCYDLEFPEWVRLTALAGAELLCVPTNWPSFPRPECERPGEVVRAQAVAAINRMFVAACDRAGPERGVDWVGGSVIVGCDGFPLAGPARAGETITLFAALELEDARDKRLTARNDVFGDRRPELYG